MKKIEKSNSDPMVSFMKKQVEQHHKNNLEKNYQTHHNDNQPHNVDNGDLSDEEKLEQAKKESKAKSATQNNFRMIIKLFIENFSKYILLIILLIGSAFAIINLTPKLFGLIHILFIKLLLG